MDKQEAREILGNIIQPDGSLYNLGHYISWELEEECITLDDRFSVHELEAIVWWIKDVNKEVRKDESKDSKKVSAEE